MLGLTRQMVSLREIWGITEREEYRKGPNIEPTQVGRIEKSKKVYSLDRMGSEQLGKGIIEMGRV